MKFELDWLYLKKSLIIFLVTLVVCLAVLAASVTYHGSYASKYQKLDQKIKLSYMKIKRKNDGLRTITTHGADFASLYKAGMLDKEHRLYWLTAFRQKANQLKLLTAQYQISPQKKFSHPQLISSSVQLHISKMKINVHLLHEMDLLHLLSVFKSVPGSHQVSACEIKRLGKTIDLVSGASTLTADCDIDWYTILPERLANAEAAE